VEEEIKLESIYSLVQHEGRPILYVEQEPGRQVVFLDKSGPISGFYNVGTLGSRNAKPYNPGYVEVVVEGESRWISLRKILGMIPE
jgi:hypothetical protein